MSSTANPHLAQKFCDWRESSNLVLATTSLILIFLFWPPVVPAQLRSPSPHSFGTISSTVLLAEENRPAGGLRVQVRTLAGGLAAMAVTDGLRVIRRGLELAGTSWTGHYYLAVAAYSQNRLDEAEKSAREAILRRPDFPLSHLLLAQIHLRKRDYATLLSEVNTYLRLEPSGPMNGQARQMREEASQALSKSDIVQEPVAIEH